VAVTDDAVSVVPEPMQITAEVGLTVTTGAFTVTADVAVALQPLPSVPVTVYVVVVVGLAVTVVPVVGDKPATGNHE
jgi:hypothetical protein